MILIAARILPHLDLAGEVQVELVWRRPVIKNRDYKALLEAMKTKNFETSEHTEVRKYATVEMAEHAVRNLSPEIQLT